MGNGVPVPLPPAVPNTAGADGDLSEAEPLALLPPVPLPPVMPPNAALAGGPAAVEAAAASEAALPPKVVRRVAGGLLVAGPAMKEALPVQGGVKRRPDSGSVPGQK